MKMKTGLFFVLKFFMFLCVSGSCGTGRGVPGSGFSLFNAEGPGTLDPHYADSPQELRVFYALFEGLTGFDPRTMQAVPGVAKSWESNGDMTVHTFHLRRTSFSNGEKITAWTVAESWRRCIDPGTASPNAWLPVLLIKGAAEFASGKSGADAVAIETPDAYTLRFETRKPVPDIAAVLYHQAFAPVPLSLIAEHGSDWTRPGIFAGNGPFVLDNWSDSDRMILVPNRRYWDRKSVSLNTVTFRHDYDPRNAAKLYERGELDWAPVPDAVAGEYEECIRTPFARTVYCVFSVDKPPFSDSRVRMALSMSLDRDALVHNVHGGGIAAVTVVPPVAGYRGASGNGYNPELAAALLAGAGYPGGKGFPPVTLLSSYSTRHNAVTTFLSQQWRSNLGISVDIDSLNWQPFLSAMRLGRFDIALSGWATESADPAHFLYSFTGGNPDNNGRYNSSSYDTLLEKADRLPAGDERMEMLSRAEDLLVTEDQAVLPLFHHASAHLIDTQRWGGWYANSLDLHPLKYIFRKKSADR